MKDTNIFFDKYDNYMNNPKIGYVYCVYSTFGDKVYIGSTSRTVEKRFSQHIWKPTLIKPLVDEYGIDSLKVKCLYESRKKITRKELREIEQSFIDNCDKSINKKNAIINSSTMIVKRGGNILFEGDIYPTKKELWEKFGKVPYNTFKTRLHRGKTIEESLGI